MGLNLNFDFGGKDKTGNNNENIIKNETRKIYESNKEMDYIDLDVLIKEKEEFDRKEI